MNDLTDSAVIGDLARRMNSAVARESIAASNLANIDTPGFRSLDATFADVLDGQLTPVVTAKGHQRLTGGAAAAGTAETPGLPSRRDGNNVQLDRELVAMNRAAADFSAAQTALSAKFRLVRYAINEGR